MVSTARPADQLMRATVALGLLIEGRLVSKGWSLGQYIKRWPFDRFIGRGLVS